MYCANCGYEQFLHTLSRAAREGYPAVEEKPMHFCDCPGFAAPKKFCHESRKGEPSPQVSQEEKGSKT